MTYSTIDRLPDLTKGQMSTAQPLVLAPMTDDGGSASWDAFVHFFGRVPEVSPTAVFSFAATAGIPYYFFSRSERDPFMIQVYDSFGNVIALDGDMDGTNGDGGDMVADFIAPYSGTFYVSPGWNPAPASPAVSLSMYADLNPVVDLPNDIKGTAASDPKFYLTHLKDHLDGGAGIDSVFVSGSLTTYDVVLNAGSIHVTAHNGYFGPDILRNIEVVEFTDATLDMAYAGLTQALYVSYFGRAADMGGLQSFQKQLAALDAPSTVNEFSARYATDPAVKSLIDSFGASSESKALYTGDNKAFVNAIYYNLLNRVPDQAGLDFWSGAIDSGALTRANASLSIMAGALANNTAQGRADAALVQVKIDVASNFTYALETAKAAPAYNGAEAAEVARSLLRSLSAGTDVLDFQASVIQAVGRLPAAPRSTTDHLDDLPQAGSDAPQIVLTGIGSTVDAAFLG